MSKCKFRNVGIEQIAACVPRNTVKIDDARFAKVTGIHEKRVSPGYTASWLGLKAAQALNLEGVEFVIFASQTHDHIIPFNSNKIQAELGLPKTTGTMDINTGCTGFVTGLMTAFSIASFIDGKVLFIIGDTLSWTTGDHDPASRLIFGDAAAACVIGYDRSYSDSYFSLYSDGSKRDAIRMTGGGFAESDFHKPEIYMDGDAVLNFALFEVPKAVEAMEYYSDKQPENYLYHQSNKMILKQFEKALPFYATMPMNIDRFGNTSGASIPLLIVTEKVRGLSLLCGYGSGLTWGVAVVDLDCVIKPLVEI